MDQIICKGQTLVDVDYDFFIKENIDMTCPIIVTNANSRKIKILKDGIVQREEKDILAIVV